MTGKPSLLWIQVINANQTWNQSISTSSKKANIDTPMWFYHCTQINAAGRIKHGNHAVELLTI
jgi:hypothetical protein